MNLQSRGLPSRLSPMSEQLTLDGLGDSKPKKKKSDSSVEQRIEKLMELKGRLDAFDETPPKDSRFQAVREALQVEHEPVPVPVAEPEKPKEPEVITVSQLNKSIKKILEGSFPLVWVKGEISNFKMPASGHWYFTLKDSGAQIRAIMFKGFTQGLKFKPQDGMEVMVRAKVTVYEPRGDYQVFCEVMEPVGLGALQIAFEQLKAKLQAEGLFDPKRKRPIPSFPTRIAIVTSPTGAAIRDMLNILSRRFGGGLDIRIIPTSVQGDKAPGEIVKAINLVNALGPDRFDVCIVGRGGGSIEDMWSFNMEEVARAVAGCRVPTISAVGHEVDFTICDFVADLRAPTPSAAAELVVKNKADLSEKLKVMTRQLVLQLRKKHELLKTQVTGLSKRLIDPRRKLQDLVIRCDELTDRLSQGVLRHFQKLGLNVRILRERLGSPADRLKLSYEKLSGLEQRLSRAQNRRLEVTTHRLQSLMSLLNGVSPLRVLERGYSIVRKGREIIKKASQVQSGDDIKITLSEGELSSRIL